MKKNKVLFLLFLIWGLLFSCKNEIQKSEMSNNLRDIHSFAEEAIITHLSLDLDVDFEHQTLSGTAAYIINPNSAERIVLDVNGPDIATVKVDGIEVKFVLGNSDNILGQPLYIPINKDSKTISVTYTTKPNAAALLWLSPRQTQGKNQPFLFSQGEAILTRSWIPIQDSPGIRFTYEATVKVPSKLMAVMSATNVQIKSTDGVYHFKMPQPIPAYLIALAVGDLAFKSISNRSGVYAEPSILDKATNEFTDTEKMIVAAENLYGPYAWDRYDLLVLPPSFPFGGMENPRLTFVTPTVIAGDRSLVSLIAHELAHSWSGNYVTNGNWNDFWINEGFTTYFERRIMESLYGRQYEEMLASLAKKDWEDINRDLGDSSKDTHLHLDLKGRNPDDGMTNIAYEKGSFMLRMLEEDLGRERFDIFLVNYFKEHAFQSMTSEKLLVYMKSHLPIDSMKINIDEWVYGPGIPANAPNPVSDKFSKVETAFHLMNTTNHWDKNITKDWSSHEWVHMISLISPEMKFNQLAVMDKAFNFSNSGNCEILDAWFEKAILAGYAPEILEKIREFLVQIGRRKYVMPLYKAFKTSGQLETARQIYSQARPNYHSVATNSIDALLKE